jgi:glycosyltransferase involved in cell wall biosynthesis
MITLITSRIKDKSPDIELLQRFEQYCASNSDWSEKKGAVVFNPRNIASRLYASAHTLLKPIFSKRKINGAILSLGLPYRLTLFSKTFPYYAFDCDLRVLWTYDVWEPDYDRVEKMVKEAKIDMLLLSSFQATSYFSKLNIPGCEVHWVSETVNPKDYVYKPWNDRKTDILSFGRTWQKYHEAIIDGCNSNNIDYRYQERNEQIDVAVQGLKKGLQFPTQNDFVEGLADAKICICFPRCITHPDLAGNVSTVTLRYLQAMASKCLIIGSTPAELKMLLNYDAVIEVDWEHPMEQIQNILNNPEPYQELLEKNYNTVLELFQHQNSITKINSLINKRLRTI